MFDFLKKKRENPPGKVCAVIPAAGSSTRMGGQNKLLLPLLDVPVLARTLAVFETSEKIHEVILVCREQDIITYSKLVRAFGFSKVTNIIRGGETRADSVLAGVKACPEETKLVAIHDGARPLVTGCMIDETVQAAEQHDAAAPVVPLKDSIKKIENGFIVTDIPRETIAAVQTPQVFDRDLLERALEQVITSGCAVTDDCAAVERLGVKVCATQGSYENIKITTPEDIAMGESLLAGRAEI